MYVNKILFHVKFLCCYELLQLINTTTTIKLIKLPEQINDHFYINDNHESFTPVVFFNVYIIKLYIVCSHPIKVIKNNFLYCNSKKAKFRSNQPHKYIA